MRKPGSSVNVTTDIKNDIRFLIDADVNGRTIAAASNNQESKTDTQSVHRHNKKQQKLSSLLLIFFSQILYRLRALQLATVQHGKKIAGYLKKQSVVAVQSQLQSNNINDFAFRYQNLTRDVYQIINNLTLREFSFPFVDSLFHSLDAIVKNLEDLPASEDKELIVMARNELRLAQFLFGIEEIDPAYRLLLRNKAILRSRYTLDKLMSIWVNQLAGVKTTPAPPPKPSPSSPPLKQEEQAKKKPKKWIAFFPIRRRRKDV